MSKKVFISYRIVNSLMFAKQIAKDLVQRSDKLIEVFLDKDHLSAGDNLKDIEKFIEKSDLLVVIINYDWLNVAPGQYLTRFWDEKDWVRIEIEAAVKYNVPIFPLVISDIRIPSRKEAKAMYPESLSFLNYDDTVFSKIDGPNQDILYEDTIKNIFRRINVNVIDIDSSKQIDFDDLENFPLPNYLYNERPRRCPYPGLSSFSVSDAPIFYGRNNDILKFWDIVSQGDYPLVLLVGYSGVGKTSFIKAGLIPRLENKSISVHYFKYNKIQSFVMQLKAVVSKLGKEDEESIIFIDQLEESLIDNDSDKDLISLFRYVKNLRQDYPSTQVIVAFRKEYLLDVKTILFRTTNVDYAELPLLPLNRVGLMEAIQGFKVDDKVNSFFADVSIEPGLPEYISNHIANSRVSSYDSISARTPLLQLHLADLWSKCISKSDEKVISRQLTIMDYDLVKTDSLQSQYNKIMSQLSKEGQFIKDSVENGLVLSMLNELITLEFTSYMYVKNDFIDMFIANNSLRDVKNLLSKLEDNYLVREFSLNDNKYISISHDAWGPIIGQKYANSTKLGQVAWKLIDTKYNININSEYNSPLFSSDEIEIVSRAQKYMKVIPSDIQVLIGSSIEFNKMKRDKLNNALSVNLNYGLKNVDSSISKFSFEEASSIILNLSNFNSELDQIRKRSIELSTIYALGGRLKKALSILELHKVLYNDIDNQINSISTIDHLFAYLSSFNKEDFHNTLSKFVINHLDNIVPIDEGAFKMGSNRENAFSEEEPQHEVIVSSFFMAKTPVTFYQFFPYCIAKKNDINNYSPNWGIEGDNPVVNITWFDANEYCKWVNENISSIKSIKEFISHKLTSRLPSEAEWEFCARGGIYLENYEYSGSDNLDKVGWYGKNCKRTRACKSKAPNVLGVYDMSGGVREWCSDIFSKNYYSISPTVDPLGPSEGFPKSLRGGCWLNNDRACRVYSRFGSDPSDLNATFGFRIALQ